MTKFLLKEVNRHANQTQTRIKAIYVNAGKTRNPYHTLTEILRQLKIEVPDAGWQMYKLKQNFENALTETSVLIAIDEVDSIIYKEKEPLVYYLSRSPKTTLILISNNIEDLLKLPDRVISALRPHLIRLQPYKPKEITRILQERTQYALKPDAIPDTLLKRIARKTSESNDIRQSFHMLLTAATRAEKAHRPKIENRDINAAFKNQERIGKLREYSELKEKLLKLKRKYQRK